MTCSDCVEILAKKGQGQTEDQCKEDPEKDCERGGHSRIPVRFFFVSLAQFCRHNGVDAHACPHSKGDHQQLQGIDDGQGGQPRFRIFPDKQAVHNVIQRLYQLRQHDGRREF